MKITSSSNISFSAGKVHFYSDFDGTYLPVSQSKINLGINISEMRTYSEKMNNFFENTKDNIDFHITTQRSYDSYKECVKLLRDKKIFLPFPQSLITEGGYKEFFNSKNIFFTCDIFPFKQDIHKVRPSGEAKNKSYNTKLLVEDTLKQNDIIITAGNDKNDKELLNPLKYINLKEFEKKSVNKEFFKKRTSEKLEELKLIYEGKNPKLKQELESIGLLQKIEELPLYSIVVKKASKPISEKLQSIYNTFSIIGKVFVAERGKLDEAVKNIIKIHSNKSKEFKRGLSKISRDFLFEKENTNKNGIVSLITGIILLDCGLFWSLRQNQLKKKNEII